jgi:hypothetical protein
MECDMSFLTALKGFGGWVAKELAKVFAAAPKIEQVADTVLSYVAPALQIILGALDPPAAAIVAPIIAEIQKDLHVASGLIYDFGANPQAAAIIQSVEGNLQGLLDAGHVKDPALQGQVTLIINTVGSLATALMNALEQKAPQQ